ncbi:MAG: Fic family protein [Fusobacterium sp.]
MDISDVKDYTIADDKYTYPKSNVLRNKFNIRNHELLAEQEVFFTSLRLIELTLKPLKGELDFNYLKKIHKYIFQDCYDFAGEIRKVDIQKGSSKFCITRYIQIQGEEIFERLKKENYLKNYKYNEFCEKLSYFMGDLISLHPFREGNGRANREFFRILCARAGYDLDYSDFKKKDILKADVGCFNLDIEPMLKLMKSGLVKQIK